MGEFPFRETAAPEHSVTRSDLCGLSVGIVLHYDPGEVFLATDGEPYAIGAGFYCAGPSTPAASLSRRGAAALATAARAHCPLHAVQARFPRTFHFRDNLAIDIQDGEADSSGGGRFQVIDEKQTLTTESTEITEKSSGWAPGYCRCSPIITFSVLLT